MGAIGLLGRAGGPHPIGNRLRGFPKAVYVARLGGGDGADPVGVFVAGTGVLYATRQGGLYNSGAVFLIDTRDCGGDVD